jgi:uncharacterized phage protein gp47/JayE
MTTLPFEKDFDDLLTDVLTDYSNLASSPDVSIGSPVFIQGSVLSSMLWGLYRYQDWIAKQHFPDLANTVNLNHWGALYDITRTGDDTDATYLNKILAFMRQPPAGGNKQDFENWALDQDNSYVIYGGVTYYNALVKVTPNPDGVLGTVGIYTIPNDETIVNDLISSGTNTSTTANKLVDSGADFVTDEVAVGDAVTNTADNTTALVTAVDDLNTLALDTDIFTSSPVAYEVDGPEELLRRATETYIESVRPLGMLSISVHSSDPVTQAVTITVTAPEGGNVDTDAIEDAIEALMNAMSPGETLYKSSLACTALTYGAFAAAVTVPASEATTVDDDEHIRPGLITITEL